MKNIIVSYSFFVLILSIVCPTPAPAAEEYDTLMIDVPPKGGFYHIDKEFLACPVGTAQPVYMRMIALNKKGGIKIMKDREGRPVWVAKEGKQEVNVPKGCFLKEEGIIWEQLPFPETAAETANDILEAGESDTLTLDHPVTIKTGSKPIVLKPGESATRNGATVTVGEGRPISDERLTGGLRALGVMAGITVFAVAGIVASITLWLLGYALTRALALRRNPLHPLFQGKWMRNPMLPSTLASRVNAVQRGSGSGRLVEMYKVRVIASGPVLTEYRDGERPARPTGQRVLIGVYRDEKGLISRIEGAFSFCHNGMLLDLMPEEDLENFAKGGVWDNSKRIWKAASFRKAPNWGEVEDWIAAHLVESLHAPAAVAPQPVVVTPSTPLLSPPAPQQPTAEEETIIGTALPTRQLRSVPDPAEELPLTVNLTAEQLKELFDSGTARRVTLTAEQVATLVELQIPFAFEGESKDGKVVSGLGGKTPTPIDRKNSSVDPA